MCNTHCVCHKGLFDNSPKIAMHLLTYGREDFFSSRGYVRVTKLTFVFSSIFLLVLLKMQNIRINSNFRAPAIIQI